MNDTPHPERPAALPIVGGPPPAPATEPEHTEVGSVFVSNYPPFSFWGPEALADLEDVLATPVEASQPLGLYLHLPFCRKRCKFCYFRVYVDKNAADVERYLAALGREVELYAERPAIRGRRPRFVYFGGGTPSYVAVKHLRGLIDRVKAALPWDDVEEVTFECEPGTLTESKVAAYREIGVTRLSLGVENWSDAILEENGRAHLSHEIDRCLPWIRAQGFAQLNVDLIAGMVGETWESWRETVQKTIDVDPDSITIYQMELPWNTVYSRGILEGETSPVAGWETKRAWNDYAIEELTAAGYEISSAYTLVKRDQKARFIYRDALWHGADMVGTGVASFSHLQGIHFQNLASWSEYLEKLEAGELPLGRAFHTTERERLTRELILQLKLGAVDLTAFERKFAVDPAEVFGDAFERLETGAMLELDEEGRTVRLTRRGLLQVDSLLPEFYDEKYRHARYT